MMSVEKVGLVVGVVVGAMLGSMAKRQDNGFSIKIG